MVVNVSLGLTNMKRQVLWPVFSLWFKAQACPQIKDTCIRGLHSFKQDHSESEILFLPTWIGSNGIMQPFVVDSLQRSLHYFIHYFFPAVRTFQFAVLKRTQVYSYTLYWWYTWRQSQIFRCEHSKVTLPCLAVFDVKLTTPTDTPPKAQHCRCLSWDGDCFADCVVDDLPQGDEHNTTLWCDNNHQASSYMKETDESYRLGFVFFSTENHSCPSFLFLISMI